MHGFSSSSPTSAGLKIAARLAGAGAGVVEELVVEELVVAGGGSAGTMPAGVRSLSAVPSVASAPAAGSATYSDAPSALTAGLVALDSRFAAAHGVPARGVAWKQPSRVSAPVAGSRENATTLAERSR